MSFIQIPNYATREKNYESFDQFKKLSIPHRVLVVIISIIVGLPTFGIAVIYVAPLLIGRLRKLELSEYSNQTQTAKKIVEVVNKAQVKNSPLNSTKEAIPKRINKTAQQESRVAIEKSLEELAYDGDIAFEDVLTLSEEMKKEKILQNFWADYAIIDTIIEKFKTACKKKQVNIKGHLVFKKYCEYKMKNKEKLQLNTLQKTLIIDEIDELLKERNDPITFPYPLTDNTEVITLKTIGDGSCAFHALLGKPIDGFYRVDAIKAREQFCAYLKNAFNEKKLPRTINTALDDYFSQPDQAPEFKKALVVTVGKDKDKKTIDLLKRYKNDYENLDFAEQDKQKKAFKADPLVFETYLNYLKKNSTYLLQDELIAVAEFYNKRIRLFQREWGDDNNKNTLGQGILNAKGAEEIAIYYRAGTKHYERALTRPIKKTAT